MPHADVSPEIVATLGQYDLVPGGIYNGHHVYKKRGTQQLGCVAKAFWMLSHVRFQSKQDVHSANLRKTFVLHTPKRKARLGILAIGSLWNMDPMSFQAMVQAVDGKFQA